MRIFLKLFIVALCCVGLLFLAACSDDDNDNDNGDAEACDCEPNPMIEENGLYITFEDQKERKPANISVLFKVDKEGRTPVTDLRTQDLTLYEDGVLISEYESQQALIRASENFRFHILLLLDLSGSVLQSQDGLKTLKNAARNFVYNVMPTSYENAYEKIDMGIHWFDGDQKIHQLVPFSPDSERLIAGVDEIEPDISQDPSTNLYGAVVQGAQKAQTMAGKEGDTVSVSALVLFTDGRDQAGWRSRQEAVDAVRALKENVSVYTIGLGDQINEAVLADIGEDGFVLAENVEELVPRFEEIAERINDDVNSHYLLEYCSPKRQGEHDLTIEISYGNQSGALTTCFCAQGFEGGCQITYP